MLRARRSVLRERDRGRLAPAVAAPSEREKVLADVIAMVQALSDRYGYTVTLAGDGAARAHHGQVRGALAGGGADHQVAGTQPIYRRVAELVTTLNATRKGASGYGPVGGAAAPHDFGQVLSAQVLIQGGVGC